VLNLRVEHQLLLALVAPLGDRAPLLAALIRAPGFSWPAFERDAVAWGLAPLVDHRLREAGLIAGAPDSVARHLAAIRHLTAVRNALLLRRLSEVAAACAGQGIPLIVLKGGDLMQTLYTHPSLRIVLDLDLLVPAGDVSRAEALLAGLGYAPAAAMERDWFDENLHHGLPWQLADGSACIELHWALTRPSDPFRVDPAGIWARAIPLSPSAPGTLRLSASDNVEYLATHLFRHLTAPDGALRSLADLALLLDSAAGRSLDWESLLERSRGQGTGLPLALALRLLEEAGPGRGARQRAAAFEAAVNDPALLARADHLLRELFRMPPRQPHAIVSGLSGLGQARGPGARVGFILRGLFPGARHLNRDLRPGQQQLPLLLRYPALAFNYFRELGQLGPRAARGAYRLGRIRREMEKARER
jgi:hypothetical protein